MGLNVSPPPNTGSSRTLPTPGPNSFLAYDWKTTTGGILVPGDASSHIANVGVGGAITFDAATSGGDGAPIACAAPARGIGADFGGTGAGNGSLGTTLTTAPMGALGVTLDIACRFRNGFGTGSPILFTKSYPAVGAGWGAPFNAIGISLSASLDGQFDCNINIGGVNVGQHFGDRYVLPPNTDLWLTYRKTAAGRSTMFVQGTPIADWSTPGNIDYGAGQWMAGGNIHTASDTINGALYWAELQTAELTNAQILARARAWLGWS